MLQSVLKQFQTFDASGYRVGIVRACFNDEITKTMLEKSIVSLHKYQVVDENISLFEVPGCAEIPVVLQALAETEDFDALIALGCVIRGDTAHFDYVCKLVTEGVLKVSLEHTLPIGFGIITVNNLAQAEERVSFGADSAIAALQAAKIVNEL